MYLTEDDLEGLSRVMAIIANDMSRRPTIDILSAEAGMSKSKFKQYFKFFTGVPAFTFQQNKRMNNAYEMVTGSRYSLNKIAMLCGYEFVSHFSEAFTKRFLISPAKLRRCS